jgi:hypothetical protein
VREQGSPDRYSHRPALLQTAPGEVLAFGGSEVFLYRIGNTGGAPGSGPHFPGEWWVPDPPAQVVASVASSTPQSGMAGRLLDDLWQARSSLMLLAAGLVALWLAGQWWSRYRTEGSAGVSRGPGWGSWLTRGLIYGGVVWMAGPHLIAYFKLQSDDMNVECGVRPSACLGADTRLLERQWSVPGRSKFSSTRIPCAFVGEWTAQAGNRQFLIRLNAEGTYAMPSQTQGVSSDSGHWAVQGGYMLWRSSARPRSEMDINRIVANDGQHLELIEADGRHSHFDRRADLPRMNCEP